MFPGILDFASDFEKLSRAHQRIEEMKLRYPSKASVKVDDPALYAGLRQKRREALSMHAELQLMHDRLPADAFGATHSQLGAVRPAEGLTPRPRSFASKATVVSMLRELEKSPFFIDNGKAVLEARPPASGINYKLIDGVLDTSCKLAIYSRKHPLKAAGIALAILAAKLLFVYVVWKAISEPVKALFGIHSKKKDDDDGVTVHAKKSSRHNAAANSGQLNFVALPGLPAATYAVQTNAVNIPTTSAS